MAASKKYHLLSLGIPTLQRAKMGLTIGGCSSQAF